VDPFDDVTICACTQEAQRPARWEPASFVHWCILAFLHSCITLPPSCLSVRDIRMSSTPPDRSRDRSKYLAGTEIGAGVFTVDTNPDDTAAELQAVQVMLA
jgi:hypothetical protein